MYAVDAVLQTGTANIISEFMMSILEKISYKFIVYFKLYHFETIHYESFKFKSAQSNI